MKLNTIKKLFLCLRDENPEIILPEEVIKNALLPIERMLEISKQRNLVR
jgi:quinolinate synthase